MEKFICKVCGAELYWDSTAKCLKCEYCDSKFMPSDFQSENKKEENNKTKTDIQPENADTDAKASDNSDSTDLVVYKCNHCGAEIVTARSTVATTCAYCNRAISLSNKLVDNFKPDYVVPFLLNQEKAMEIYKKYATSSKLIPKKFLEDGEIKKIKGIYVPFWLHSFTNNAETVLECYNETSTRSGYDKVITRHIYRVDMDTSYEFENVPADALKNIDNSLISSIEPFDYSKMTSFLPAYMAGYYAEEYNETKDDTILGVLKRADEATKSEIINHAGAYEGKLITNYKSDIEDYDAKYAMMPIWLLNVEYENKRHTFAINGQTGKIAGKLPVCKKNVFKYSAISFMTTLVVITICKIITML